MRLCLSDGVRAETPICKLEACTQTKFSNLSFTAFKIGSKYSVIFRSLCSGQITGEISAPHFQRPSILISSMYLFLPFLFHDGCDLPCPKETLLVGLSISTAGVLGTFDIILLRRLSPWPYGAPRGARPQALTLRSLAAEVYQPARRPKAASVAAAVSGWQPTDLHTARPCAAEGWRLLSQGLVHGGQAA